jgi:hypothetical protein
MTAKPLILDEPHDWWAQNTYGIAGSQKLYRVFRVKHLLPDLKESRNTLVRPSFKTQKDALENPYLDKAFDFDGRPHKVIRDIMVQYYSQSWSFSPPAWSTFGGDDDKILISTTAAKLFCGLMDDDCFCSPISYYLWKITYLNPDEIKKRIALETLSEILENQGARLLESVMTIRSGFAGETEARLLFIRHPEFGAKLNTWAPLRTAGDDYCAHKFNWVNLIEDFRFPEWQSPCDELLEAIAHSRQEGES